jgi:phosphotriesterase-related protein
VSTGQVMVQTAAGPQALSDGIIYAHEHLWLDLTTLGDPQGKLDQFDLIVEEIGELKRLGVGAIIEQTCLGMGRDVARLREIQLAAGVQIIPATGYYHRRFHPPTLSQQSVEQIAETLAHELRAGVDGTAVRPMVLGEIGGSGPPLYNDEVKVFRAVARLAQEFPVVVTTHAHLGCGGGDELQLLVQEGLAPERVLIGHLDLCPSLEEVLAIARQGAYVGFDTVGKINYAPDERRVVYIKALIEAGLGRHILLSCDISRNAYLRQRGGQGYAYLLRVFLPMLADASIAPATIRQITQENPRRFLSGASGRALS